MADNHELDAATLLLLDEANGPIGSASLAAALAEAGFQISEATAGRLLRSLDTRGFTRMPGPKLGRQITPKGREQLRKLRTRHTVEKRGAAIVEAVRDADNLELLDLLIARRAVETEGARLAAQNATADELARIAELASSNVEATSAGRMPGITDSSNFHRSIVAASHNRILVSIAELLFDNANPNLARALENVTIHTATVREQSHHHSLIAEALQSREPERAAEMVKAHLTHLMEAVSSQIGASGARREPSTEGAGGDEAGIDAGAGEAAGRLAVRAS